MSNNETGTVNAVAGSSRSFALSSEEFLRDGARSPARSSSNRSGTREWTPPNWDPFCRYHCRICYRRNTAEPNLSLCSCRGTLGLVHKSCLEQWLVISHSSKCELCGYNFNLTRKLKYGVFKGMAVWLRKKTPKQRYNIAMDCLKLSTALLMLLVINYQSLLLMGSLQAEDTSVHSLLSPFYPRNSNWNDALKATNKLLKMLALALSTPFVLAVIARQLMILDKYYFSWRRWYNRQCVVEVVVPEDQRRRLQ